MSQPQFPVFTNQNPWGVPQDQQRQQQHQQPAFFQVCLCRSPGPALPLQPGAGPRSAPTAALPDAPALLPP